MPRKLRELSPFRFQDGDIVTTKPNNTASFSMSKTAAETMNRIRNNPRRGIILKSFHKTNARGAAVKVCLVQWETSSRSTEHYEMRLCKWEERQAVQENLINSIGA